MVEERRRLLGAGRRLLARVLAMLPQAAYLPPRPIPAAGGSTSRPIDVGIGRFWLAVEQPVRAQGALERAAALGDPRARVLLGQAILAGGPIGFGVEAHLGVGQRRVGDPASALTIFEEAQRRDPQSDTARRGVIATLMRLSEWEEAEFLAALGGDTLDLLATIRLRLFADAGVVTRDELRTITPLLAAHLEHHPFDSRVRDRLARAQTSLLDFDAASVTADLLPRPRVTRELAEWTQRTSSGRHEAAYRHKLATARQIAREPARRTGPAGDMVLRLQAINFSEGPDAAARAVGSRWVALPTRTEKQIRDKTSADLSLLLGDPTPLRRFAHRSSTPTPGADSRFRSMITGKKVLVIGPSPSNRPTPELVSQHDVVVTTGRPFEQSDPAHPSIVYVNDEAFLATSRTPADADAGHAHLTVVRPSILGRLRCGGRSLVDARVAPIEDSTPFLGTHFAIQRILYDLIAHDAAHISISGADFFLGEQTYVDGYHERAHDRFASVPFNFSHDFTYDFWWTKTLRERGLVHAPGAVGDLLDQPVDWYLRQLGRVFL